jgi:hypothetical protein
MGKKRDVVYRNRERCGEPRGTQEGGIMTKKPKIVWVGSTPITPITSKERKKLHRLMRKRLEMRRKRYPEVRGKVVDYCPGEKTAVYPTYDLPVLLVADCLFQISISRAIFVPQHGLIGSTGGKTVHQSQLCIN